MSELLRPIPTQGVGLSRAYTLRVYLHSPHGMPPRIACFGASGTCVQIALDLRYQAQGAVDFVGYVDDLPNRTVDSGWSVRSFEELVAEPDVGVFVPVHDPAGRARVFDRLSSHGIPIVGSRGLPHLAHPDAEIGEGTIVSLTTRVGHNTRIGRGCIAVGELVAHDVVVGDFVTLAAQSAVLGHVQIGNGAYIGAGAIVKNGTQDRPLVIGAGAVIGTGAVVGSDVGAGEVVMGPRARPIREWIRP